jgi:hypothetical protein
MTIIIYLLISLGLCYAWSDTEASRPLRNMIARIPYIRRPLLCHECSSFWIGLGLSYFINPIGEYCNHPISYIFSAFCSFFINLVFVRNKYISLKD